jgi:hypothetical protein
MALERCTFSGHLAGKKTVLIKVRLLCSGLELRGESKKIAVAVQTDTS